jgi:hypothetical protein
MRTIDQGVHQNNVLRRIDPTTTAPERWLVDQKSQLGLPVQSSDHLNRQGGGRTGSACLLMVILNVDAPKLLKHQRPRVIGTGVLL